MWSFNILSPPFQSINNVILDIIQQLAHLYLHAIDMETEVLQASAQRTQPKFLFNWSLEY